MANMTFGVNLVPNNGTNNVNQRSLGNSDNKWDIYVNNINGITTNNGLNFDIGLFIANDGYIYQKVEEE